MYEYIKGEVTALRADYAVLDAGGIGYLLHCSAKTLGALKQGESAKLWAHLHLGDDIMALYGFYDETERMMFRRLVAVTRVGPKLALSVLSTLTPADIAAAIVTDNAAAFKRVPGMGTKTAQRVVLELKGKVGADEMVSAGLSSSAITPSDARSEAVAALVALGYDGATASRAVSQVDCSDSVEAVITAALRYLAKS